MARNERWQEYYRDEQDAAFLYRALAEMERDDTRRNLFARMATVEDRHVDRWAELFAQHHQAVPTHHPSRRARLLAWVARRAGPSVVLPLVLAEEGREVIAYLALAESTLHEPMYTAAQGLAAESAGHARELAKILGRETEPWHAAGAGGYLRVIVYGFNDGLTANLWLVAGVIGASVQPPWSSPAWSVRSRTRSQWAPAETSQPRARRKCRRTRSIWSVVSSSSCRRSRKKSLP